MSIPLYSIPLSNRDWESVIVALSYAASAEFEVGHEAEALELQELKKTLGIKVVDAWANPINSEA